MIIRKSRVVKCFLILISMKSIIIESKPTKKKDICPLGQYYDLESLECKKVPCGGTVIHEDTSLRCTGRFLGIKVHPTYQQYYYICNPSSVVFVKCPENQIFNSTISHCQPSEATPSDCKRTGRFPISSNSSLFYICDTDGQKLVRKLMECPKNTVFNPKTQRCSCVHQCTPTEIDPADYFEDYDEEIFPPCTRPGRFRSPTDCSFYYTCSGKTNGKFYQTRYRCPVGTYYDIQKEKCRNERRVKCDLMTVEELIKEYERTHNYNESDVSAESAELNPLESTTVIPLVTTASDLHGPDSVSESNVPVSKPSTDFSQYEGNDEDYGIPSEFYPEIDSDNSNSKTAITTAKYEDIEPLNVEVQKLTTSHDSSIFSHSKSPESIVHITPTVTPSSSIEEPVNERVEISPTTSSTLNQAETTSALPNSKHTISNFEESTFEAENTHKLHLQVNEDHETSHSTIIAQPSSTPLYSDIIDKETSQQPLVDEKSGKIDEVFTTVSFEADNNSKSLDKLKSFDETIGIDQRLITEQHPQEFTTILPHNKPQESDDSGVRINLDTTLPTFEVTEIPANLGSRESSKISYKHDVTTPASILITTEKSTTPASETTFESKSETTTALLEKLTITETQPTETFNVAANVSETKSPDFQPDEIFSSTLTIQETTVPTNTELSSAVIEDSSISPPMIQDGVTDPYELNEDVVITTTEEEQSTSEKPTAKVSKNLTTSVHVDPHDMLSSSEVMHDLNEFSPFNQTTLIDEITTIKALAESITTSPLEETKNSSYAEEFQIIEKVTEKTDQPETVAMPVVQEDPETLITPKAVTETVHETPFIKTTRMEPDTLSTEMEKSAKIDQNTNDDEINITETTTWQDNIMLTSEHSITNREETFDNSLTTENPDAYEEPVTQPKRISTIDTFNTNSSESTAHSTVAPEYESLPHNGHSTENSYPQSDSFLSTTSLSPEIQVSTKSPEIKQPTDQPTKNDWAESTKNTDFSLPVVTTMISETLTSKDTTVSTNEKEGIISSVETNLEGTTINYDKTYSPMMMQLTTVLATEPISTMIDSTTVTPAEVSSENILDTVENQTNVPDTTLNWSVEPSSLSPEDGLDQIKSDLQAPKEIQSTEESQTSFPTTQYESYTPEKNLENSTLSPPKTTALNNSAGENHLDTEVPTIKETATTPLSALDQTNGISTSEPQEYSENQSNELINSIATSAETQSAIDIPLNQTEIPPEIETLTSSQLFAEDLISVTSTTAAPHNQLEVVVIDKSDELRRETSSPAPVTDYSSSENNMSTAPAGESEEDHTSGEFSSEIFHETISTDLLTESLPSVTVSSSTSPPQEIALTDSIPFNTPSPSTTTQGPLNISCTKFNEANLTALHLEDKSVEILNVHISKPLKLLLHFHPKFSCDDCDKSKKHELKERESDQKGLKTLHLSF